MTRINPLFFISIIISLITSCVTLDMFDEADFSSYPQFSNDTEQSITQVQQQFEQLLSSEPSINSLQHDNELPMDSAEQSAKTQLLSKNELPTKPPLLKAPPVEPVIQPECQENTSAAFNQQEILSNYRLGAGDLINIKVFGEEDFSITTHLSETGTISYPFLEELSLSGLTVNEIERLIISGLKGDYLVNPKVTVMVLEYRKVFVNGEVKNSGGYTFVPGLTVNKAISLAGGLTEMASRETFFIVRNGNQDTTPLCATLKTYIRPGDIILVKEYQKFFVDGQVKNPGGYAFKRGLTVKKAISLAGGFTDRASPEEIFINEGQQSTQLDTLIKPGDIITVKEYKKFFVNGEVQKPGGYDFEPDLTVEKAVALAGGFTEFGSARWSKIFILRDGHETVMPTSVQLNTPIQPGDIITVKESIF